jgi:hypothetical protein
MPILSMGAQNPLEAGFAGDIDILVSEHRNDPGRRQRGETRLVSDGQDAFTFLLAQRVRGSRPFSTRATVTDNQVIVGPPALQRARSNAGNRAGLAQARLSW